MDYAPSPKLLTATAAAAAAAASLAALRWLAAAPPPKRGAEKRAELAKRWWQQYLEITPHFDQFFKHLVINSMAPDGKASGSIVVEGPLVSADGILHEGALFGLVDTFGSLPIMAAGYVAGVSLEMGVTNLKQVKEGEELKLESQILRIGSTIGFTAVQVRRPDGQLVATGSHTKHIGQPFLERARHSLFSRVLPLQRWWSDRGLRKLKDICQKLDKAPPAKTMEDALGLNLLPPENEHGVHSYAVENLHLLNGYWAGHGASSAGLIAAAAREHLKQQGAGKVVVQDMSVLYLNPVPAFKPVGLKVMPLSDEESLAPEKQSGIRQYIVELREAKKVYVRARLTAILC